MNQRSKAIIYMNIACAFQVVYHCLAKKITTQKSYGPKIVELVDFGLVRCLILSFWSLCQIIYKRLSFTEGISAKNVKMLVLRCLIGVLAYVAAMIAVMRIPVSTFAILMNTSPFWAALLGYLISRDKILKFEFVCIIGCFIGVYFLTQKDRSISE